MGHKVGILYYLRSSLFGTLAIFPIRREDLTGFSLRLTAPFGSDGYVVMPHLRHIYAVSIRCLELAYEMMFGRNASSNDVASSFCNLSLHPETASRDAKNFRLPRIIAHRSLILYSIAKNATVPDAQIDPLGL